MSDQRIKNDTLVWERTGRVVSREPSLDPDTLLHELVRDAVAVAEKHYGRYEGGQLADFVWAYMRSDSARPLARVRERMR